MGIFHKCRDVLGGNLIHVWGHNFPEAEPGSQYKCRFGSDVVDATREAWNHVTCQAPQHVAGDVILEVSQDGVEFTNNDVRLNLILAFQMNVTIIIVRRQISSIDKHFSHNHILQ